MNENLMRPVGFVIDLNKAEEKIPKRPSDVPPNAEYGGGKMRGGKPVSYLWRWKDKSGNWQYKYKKGFGPNSKKRKKKVDKRTAKRKRRERQERIEKMLENVFVYEPLVSLNEKRIRDIFAGQFNPKGEEVQPVPPDKLKFFPKLHGELSSDKKQFKPEESRYLNHPRRYLEIAFKQYEDLFGKDFLKELFKDRGYIQFETNEAFYAREKPNVAGYMTRVNYDVHIPEGSMKEIGIGTDPNKFRSRKTFSLEVIWHEMAHVVYFKSKQEESFFRKMKERGLFKGINTFEQFDNEFKKAAVKDGGRYISPYASTMHEEDFAESFAAMVSHPAQMAEICPNRYRLLQRAFFPKLPKDPNDYTSGRVKEKQWWNVSLDPMDALRDAIVPEPYLEHGIMHEAGDKYYRLEGKNGFYVYFRTNEKYTNKRNKIGIKDIYDKYGRPISMKDVALMLGYTPRKYFGFGSAQALKKTKEVTQSEFYAKSGCFNWDNFEEDGVDENGNRIFKRKTIGDLNNPNGEMIIKVSPDGKIVYPLLFQKMFGEGFRVTDVKSLILKLAENKGKTLYADTVSGDYLDDNGNKVETFHRVISFKFNGGEKFEIGGDYYNRLAYALGITKSLDDKIDSDILRKILSREDKIPPTVETKPISYYKLEVGNPCYYRSETDGKLHPAHIVDVKKTYSFTEGRDVYTYTIRPEGDSPKLERFTSKEVKDVDIVAKATEKIYDQFPFDILIYKDNRSGSLRIKMPKDTEMTQLTEAGLQQSLIGISKPLGTDENQDMIITMDGVLNLNKVLGGYVCTDDVMKDLQTMEEALTTSKKEKTAKVGKIDKETITPAKLPGMRLTTKLEGMPIKLGEHQKDAVKFCIENNGRAMYSHEMGTGKTLEGIVTHLTLKREGLGKKTLFVVPANTLSNWEAEFENFTEITPTIIAGQYKKYRDGRNINNVDWSKTSECVIVGHEYFARHRDKILRKNRFQTVIVDEAHRFKQGNLDPAKRSKLNQSLREASEVVDNLVMMSGTFITDTLKDLPEYLRLISNGVVDLGTKEEFVKTYVARDPITGKMTQPKNLEKLAAIVGKYAHIVTSADVKGKIMPFANVKKALVECINGEQAAYQDLLYKKLAKKLTPEELEKLKQIAEGKIPEEEIDANLKRKIQNLRNVANCPNFIKNEGDKFLIEKVDIIDRKGNPKGQKSIPVRYPEKLPDEWPGSDSPEDIKMWHLMIDYLLPAMGYSNEEIEKFREYGRTKHKMPPEIKGKRLPDHLIGNKIPNPFYNQEGIRNVYRRDQGGPFMWKYDTSSGEWFERKIGVDSKGKPDLSKITKRKVTDRKELNQIYQSVMYANSKAQYLRDEIIRSLNNPETYDEEMVIFGNRIVPSTQSCVAACETAGLRNVKDALNGEATSPVGKYYTTYIGHEQGRDINEKLFRKDKNGNPLILKLIEENKLKDDEKEMLKKDYGIDVKKGLTDRQIKILKNVKVMVASDAANVGLNFGNAAKLYEYDQIFSPTMSKQRIARITRMLNETNDPKIKELWDKFKTRYENEVKALYGIEGEDLAQKEVSSETSFDIINKILASMPSEDVKLLEEMGMFKNVERILYANPIKEEIFSRYLGEINIGEASILGAAQSKQRGIEKAFLAFQHLRDYIDIGKTTPIPKHELTDILGTSGEIKKSLGKLYKIVWV